jgi:RNA polymerase sigma-70 factor (ECF subfamily)
MTSLDSELTPVGLDDESERWLRDLSSQGRARELAMTRLHELLLRIARGEVARRNTSGNITGPELDDLAHQAAADAMVAIIRKLREYRGASRFTTWAYKFVMFEVSAKLGRHFWRNPGVSLEPAHWERLPDRFGLDPGGESQWRDLVRAIRIAVERDLTEHQRTVFVGLVINGVPLDALALELNSSRNALYKTLYDARRKLRSVLAADGFLSENSSRHP